MTLREQLLELSVRYGEAAKLSASRVSTIIFNDGKTLARVANGGDVTTASFERALVWFSDHWPVDVRWPETVSRPQFASARDVA